jgi:hypothetical protein
MKEVLADPTYQEGEFKAGSIASEPGDPKGFQQYLQSEELRLSPLLANLKVE